jgi:hypothetical protein
MSDLQARNKSTTISIMPSVNRCLFDGKKRIRMALDDVVFLSETLQAKMLKVQSMLDDRLIAIDHWNQSDGSIQADDIIANTRIMTSRLIWVGDMLFQIEANIERAIETLDIMDVACSAGLENQVLDNLIMTFNNVKNENDDLLGRNGKDGRNTFQDNSPAKTVVSSKSNTVEADFLANNQGLAINEVEPEPLLQIPAPKVMDGVVVEIDIQDRTLGEMQSIWIEKIQAVPPTETRVNVLMSHWKSPTDFYLQYDWMVNQSLGNTLQFKCKKMLIHPDKYFVPPEKLNLGYLCAAKYTDGLWYRCRVKGVLSQELEVTFFDWGNDSKVKKTDLLPLDESVLFNYKVQAVKCRIAGYTESIHGDSIHKIKRLLAREDLHAQFHKMEYEGPPPYFIPDDYIVELTVDEGRRLLDVIYDSVV